MEVKVKNRILFLVFSTILGMIIGVFIWSFLRIMELGMELIWSNIPKKLDFPLYTVIICLIGGIIIGFFQKKYGAYPEEMTTVLQKMKKEGKYSYNHIYILIIAAILPLVFGASIGPEAGLTGVIIALCCWAGDRFSYMGSHLRDITQMGMSATLGVIFHAPLFGFMMPIEEQEDEEKMIFPKRQKIVIYFSSILGGFGVYSLLTMLFGGGMGMPSLGNAEIGLKERIFGIILAVCGIIFGILYNLIHKLCEKVFTIIREKQGIMISVILGALLLGLIGTALPITMFSGEEQMTTLSEIYGEMAFYELILIGIVKLIITNICIQSGWRGGHFFPVIFAGVSIGYGFGVLFGVNTVFAVATVTAGLLGYIMKKPLAVVLLLLICFPMNSMVWMILAAVLGSAVGGKTISDANKELT